MARGLGSAAAFCYMTAPVVPGSSANVGAPWGTNIVGKRFMATLRKRRHCSVTSCVEIGDNEKIFIA